MKLAVESGGMLVSRGGASSRNRAERDPGGCPVCGDPLVGSGRIHHLRERHPAYWRAFLVQVASPWVFLAFMFALALESAPGWSFVAVLLGFVGLSLWARHRSAVERGQRAGRRVGQWLQGAGIGFIMMAVAFVVVALVVVLSR